MKNSTFGRCPSDRMKAFLALAAATILAAAFPSSAHGAKPPQGDYPVSEFVDPCDIGLCDCNPSYVIDLAQYFVPNYPGWNTNRKIWLSPDGGTSDMRFFSYAPNKYELIKFGNNQASETYQITADRIHITAENNINNTNATRTYPVFFGADWMPRYACWNKPQLNTFRPCHDGEYYYTSCQFTHSFPPHCALYDSRIIVYFGFDHGYNVGVVDTIVKVDKRDDRVTEKYYYGKNKGFLRWEYFEPSGAMTNWARQIDELPNSQLVHAGCFQP